MRKLELWAGRMKIMKSPLLNRSQNKLRRTCTPKEDHQLESSILKKDPSKINNLILYQLRQSKLSVMRKIKISQI